MVQLLDFPIIAGSYKHSTGDPKNGATLEDLGIVKSDNSGGPSTLSLQTRGHALNPKP